MQVSQEFNIQKYLNIFHKYKWFGLLPALVLMAMLTVVSTFLPKVYESTCVVEVERGSIDNPLRSRREASPRLSEHLNIFSQRAFKWEILSTVIETVGSERVVANGDKYNLGKLKKWIAGDPEQGDSSADGGEVSESVAAIIRNNVEIRQRPPRFLVLSYRGTDSEISAEIINTLVTSVIAERELAQFSEVTRSYEFLKSEMESYRTRLEEAETKLREFREQHVTELPNNVNVHLARLTADQAELLAVELETKELSARLSYIDDELERQKKLIVSEVRREANPMLVVLSERIVDMEIELTRLRTNYTDLHPSILELKGQLKDLKQQEEKLRQSTVNTETSMINPLHQRLTEDRQETLLRIEVLKNRMENLEERVVESEEKVRGVPAQEQQLITLTRNYEVTENIYNMFLQRLEEAKIQEKLASEERSKESFKILQFARATMTPVAPDMVKVLMIIVMLGGATAGGIMFLLDFFDDSLNSVEEAKQFINKPLLGTIPSLASQNGNGLILLRRLAPGETRKS